MGPAIATTTNTNMKLGFRRESLLRKQRNNKMISFRLPKDKTHQLLHYHSDEEEEEQDHAADATVTTMDSSRDQADDSSSDDESSSSEMDDSSKEENAEPENVMTRRKRAFQRIGNRMTSNRMTSFRLPKDKTHQLLALHLDDSQHELKETKKNNKKKATATAETTPVTPEIKYSPLLNLPLPPPLRVSKYLESQTSNVSSHSSSSKSSSVDNSDHQTQPKQKQPKKKTRTTAATIKRKTTRKVVFRP